VSALREILYLKWEYVDIERGLLFLPDSKTGKKSIVLNAPGTPGDRQPAPRWVLYHCWSASRQTRS
jgi:hypothetical protein